MSQHLIFACFPTPVQPPSLLSALLAQAPARFSDIVLEAYAQPIVSPYACERFSCPDTATALAFLSAPDFQLKSALFSDGFNRYELSFSTRQAVLVLKGLDVPDDAAEYAAWLDVRQRAVLEMAAVLLDATDAALVLLFAYSTRYSGDPSLYQIAEWCGQALGNQASLAALLTQWLGFFWLVAFKPTAGLSAADLPLTYAQVYGTEVHAHSGWTQLENRALCPLD